VDDVSFDVPPVTPSLVGPSGSGKTTMLDPGALYPHQRTGADDGMDLSQMRDKAAGVMEEKIGYIPIQ
jgi:ABC-type lipoprotein export system ATPase subunit